mgnify:CR=1 FL=1
MELSEGEKIIQEAIRRKKEDEKRERKCNQELKKWDEVYKEIVSRYENVKESQETLTFQEYCLKHDGVIYEFALKNKTSGANDVLCLSEEDAKKHILKQNLLMKFRNKRFCENDCNLDQLLLMKAGYHYDPTGPMAEHWQKILEYEKDNY